MSLKIVNKLIIDLDKCFECGAPKDDMHHVIPRCKGGKNMIPLCNKCHGEVHDKDFVNMKTLQKIGVEKQKALGLYKGRVKGTTETPEELFEKHKKVIDVLKTNPDLSLRKISELVENEDYKVSPNTVKKLKDILRNYTPKIVLKRKKSYTEKDIRFAVYLAINYDPSKTDIANISDYVIDKLKTNK